MRQNRGLWAILGVLAAVSAAGCDDTEKTQICGGDICAEGEVCNILRKKCELINVCGNSCAEGEECDAVTGRCVTSCNNCNGMCESYEICNQNSCKCEVVDCNDCDGRCNANQTCNTVTCRCEKKDTCNNCNGLCNAYQTCNKNSCSCECNNCNGQCNANENCNTNSCTCEPKDTCNNCDGQCKGKQTCNTDNCSCECNNCNGQCTGGTVCDTDSCECVADCNNCDGQCGTELICNTKTCSCEPCDGIIYNGKCIAYADNCTPACSEQYEVCTVEDCLSVACAGKVWDDTHCYCSITGDLWEDDGKTRCGEHVVECNEPEGNIVNNWSFEKWDEDGAPEFWTLFRNSTSSSSESLLKRIEDAESCTYAVQFKNDESKNARLESAPILVPEKNFSSGSNVSKVHLNCRVGIKGEGNVNFGYRGLDANGKKINGDTVEAAKQETILKTSYYKEYGWDAKFSDDAKSFQVLIGLSEGDIQVDSVSCILATNLCTGITCEHEWEICDIANHKDPDTGEYIGLCVVRKGRCSTAEEGNDSCTKDVEKCDPDEHVCKRVDGKCDNNASCPDDKPMCDANHECVAATDEEICANANCNEYRECSVATRGECVLKAGYCNTAADCPGDNPICNGDDHTCVPIDKVYDVAKRSDCLIADDFFNYLNYVDADPKKDKLHESLICPLSIVPNGSFEDWETVQFTPTSTPHPVPAWWYAAKGDNNFVNAAGRYLTEIAFDKIFEEKNHVHSGNSALRIQFEKQPADRLTSWGFMVPAGTWDCSYWVRGTGDVRVHTYSTAGDIPMTDFVHYDTDTWKRASFELKEAASDARIIIYVSNTTSARDHIQLDDFACTKRGDWI